MAPSLAARERDRSLDPEDRSFAGCGVRVFLIMILIKRIGIGPDNLNLRSRIAHTVKNGQNAPSRFEDASRYCDDHNGDVVVSASGFGLFNAVGDDGIGTVDTVLFNRVVNDLVVN